MAGMRSGSASVAMAMKSPDNSTTFEGSHSDTEAFQSPLISGYSAGLGRAIQSSSTVVALAADTARVTASFTAPSEGMLVKAAPIFFPR
jgi:hypothetical protein